MRLKLVMGPLAAVLTACATTGGKAEIELAQFLAALPGVYDNHAQAVAPPVPPAPASSASAQRALPDELVSIQPAYAPALGKHVFYVQENSAEDSRRIIAQRLVAIDANDHGVISQRDFVFTDPPRWRMAAEQLDLFKGLIVDDVHGVTPSKLRFDGTVLTMQVAGTSGALLRLDRQR